MIFSLSRGLTTVLDAAPAHPPASRVNLVTIVRFLRTANLPTKYEATSGLTPNTDFVAGLGAAGITTWVFESAAPFSEDAATTTADLLLSEAELDIMKTKTIKLM